MQPFFTKPSLQPNNRRNHFCVIFKSKVFVSVCMFFFKINFTVSRNKKKLLLQNKILVPFKKYVRVDGGMKFKR